MHAISRQDVSRAFSELMPLIIQGVQLDFFLKRGTTQTQFLVLMAIHAHGRCCMGALAGNMHVSMPTASGIVNRLAEAGHVRRVAELKDRRHVLVELTAKGKAFIRQFQAVGRRRWEEVLRPLEPRELRLFYQILTKLQRQLESSR